MKKKMAVFLVLVMALTLIAGCGAAKTIKTEDGSVSIEGGKATFEGKDGSKSEVNVADEKGGNVSLPDGYPKDLLPIIGESQIKLANKNAEDGNTTYLISLACDKSAKDVYNYYTDVLKDAQDLNNSQMDDIYSVTGVKNNLRLSVIIAPDDKKSSVQIAITPEE